MYFITARHVLFDESKNGFHLKPQLLNFLFYPRNIVTGDYATISVNFKYANDSLVKYDKDHDIAVILIADEKK